MSVHLPTLAHKYKTYAVLVTDALPSAAKPSDLTSIYQPGAPLYLLNANMILLASLLLISLQLLLHVGSTLKYLSVHCSSHLGMQNGNPSKTNSQGSTPRGRHKIPLSGGIHLVFEILLTYVLHASS